MSAPKQLNYDDVLPVAIESSSHRREFFVEGGNDYGPSGGSQPNVIRIPINADAMLDAQGSYLKFDIKNNSGANAIAFDFPQSYIRRLRLISGSGQVLEDIGAYNRLYAGILYPTQAAAGLVAESTICSQGVGTRLRPTGANNSAGVLAGGSTQTMCIHLCSALLNSDTYLPLVMMSSGLIIEIELDSANSIGCSSTGVAGTIGPLDCDWTISNVRYVAHLINLQREFYERLRMVMEANGGVLALSGTTYKHFSGNWPTADLAANINVPARLKSIKSFLWKNTIEADVVSRGKMGISGGITHDLQEFSFRVGAVRYPPAGVQFKSTNKAEAYQELRKAFGTLGSYNHGGELMDNTTYAASAAANADVVSAAPVVANAPAVNIAPFALDVESFRSSLEAGVNTSGRALPVSLELKASGNGADATVDVWTMCDAIFYVNIDGSCAVSV